MSQTSSGVQLAVSKGRSRVRSRCAEGARRCYHPSVVIQGRFQVFWITQKLAGARLLREQGPCRSASSRPSQNTSCDLRRPMSACMPPTTGCPPQATRPRSEQVGCLSVVRRHTSAANGHDAPGGLFVRAQGGGTASTKTTRTGDSSEGHGQLLRVD